MSDSLRPHELQHARPPCPSPTPGVHPDSRPSSQRCHPAISFSVIPFSSCPITSWQIEGGNVEVVTDSLFLGSKITADVDCSHENRRQLLLGRKAMTKLDSVLKSRDSILLTNICIVKAMVFPVVTYACESWTVKKAECQRVDAFKLGCWRRLLRVPWTATSPS